MVIPKMARETANLPLTSPGAIVSGALSDNVQIAGDDTDTDGKGHGHGTSYGWTLCANSIGKIVPRPEARGPLGDKTWPVAQQRGGGFDQVAIDD